MTRWRVARAAGTAWLAAVLTACGGDGTGPPAPVPASITVTSPSATVSVGGTVQLTAAVRDQAGNVMAGQPVAWSSADDAVATVGSTGLVSAASVGSVRITATSGAVSGFVDLDVTGVPCTGVHVGTLAPGQTVNGELAISDCVLADGTFADAWLLTLADPAIIEIELASSAFDAYLILSTTDLETIVEDDDGGPGSDALIWRPLPAGTYLVWANSWAPGEKGAYSLTVRAVGPCAELSGTFDVGESVAGMLEAGGCTAGPDRHADWWQLSVTDRRTVTIDLGSDSFDAYMYLLDGNFAYVAEDDDGGGGLDSSITADLDAGSYYVLVTSHDMLETGPYTLSAQPTAAGAAATDGMSAIGGATGSAAESAAKAGREDAARGVMPARPPKR
jgi:hypothetical protein